MYKNNNIAPCAMPAHNSGVLFGKRPNPPKFYPANGQSEFSNARREYFRTATPANNPYATIPKSTGSCGSYSQAASTMGKSTKYIAPQSCALLTSARKRMAVGKSSYKQGLPLDAALSYKNYNTNDVKNALRITRGGGYVAPPKCGSIYNPSSGSHCTLIAEGAPSLDGKYQTIVDGGGNIFVSSNYGTSWKLTSISGNPPLSSVSISRNGQYQTAVGSVFFNSGLSFVSSDYGHTWSDAPLPQLPYTSIAMSDDGQYQTIVSFDSSLYISSDYGKTWSFTNQQSDFTALQLTWFAVSMSSDGKYQTSVTFGSFFNEGNYNQYGTIYRSDDYGHTWTQPLNLPDLTGVLCTGISVSGSGQYQTMVSVVFNSSSNIYKSNDYGNSWTITFSPNNGMFLLNIDISENGKYQLVSGAFFAGPTYVYASKDGGFSWNEIIPLDIQEWSGVSVSQSGKVQTAITADSQYFESLDYGVTWNKHLNFANNILTAISIS